MTCGNFKGAVGVLGSGSRRGWPTAAPLLGIFLCLCMCDGISTPPRQAGKRYVPPVMNLGESSISKDESAASEWIPGRSPRSPRQATAMTRESATGASLPRRGVRRGSVVSPQIGGSRPATKVQTPIETAKKEEEEEEEEEDDQGKESNPSENQSWGSWDTPSGSGDTDDYIKSAWSSATCNQLEAEVDELMKQYSDKPVDIYEVIARQQSPLDTSTFDQLRACCCSHESRVLRVVRRQVTGVECQCPLDGYADLEPGGGGEMQLSVGHFKLPDKLRVRPDSQLVLRGSGRENSTVWGRWDMQERSGGYVSDMTFEYQPEGEIFANNAWETAVIVWGGPWLMERCDLTCIAGTPLAASVLGGLVMRDCVIGGKKDLAENAVNGLEVRMRARAELEGCVIQNTGYLAGVGARSEDAGTLRLQNCTFLENDYAVGVCGNASAMVDRCLLERQRWAAFWVGGEYGSVLRVKGSRVKGRLFHDTCMVSVNHTVRRDIQKGLYIGNEEEGQKSLHYRHKYHVRRPHVYEEEENEFLPHDGEWMPDSSVEEIDNDAKLQVGEVPPEKQLGEKESEHQFMRGFIRHAFDSMAPPTVEQITYDEATEELWFDPDQSDEDKLYADAILDTEREEAGQPPHEAIMADGTKVFGYMNETQHAMLSRRVLITQQQMHAVKGVIRAQKDYLKDLEEADEKSLPKELRRGYMSKPGKDLPHWWTPFDEENLYKSGAAQWGCPKTEWDACDRPLTKEDKAMLQEEPYTMEELLYGEKPEEADDCLEVTKTDLDPERRSAFLTWPLEMDKIRQRKLEKRMGMPYDLAESEGMFKFNEAIERLVQEDIDSKSRTRVESMEDGEKVSTFEDAVAEEGWRASKMAARGRGRGRGRGGRGLGRRG